MLVYLLMTTLASFMTFVTLGTGVCRYSLFFSLPKNKIIIVSLFLLQEVSAFKKDTNYYCDKHAFKSKGELQLCLSPKKFGLL